MAKERAVKHMIAINKTQAKSANNPDFKIKHADWVRDAATKNYSVLIKQTTDEVVKFQELHLARRNKLNATG